jgi:hypothetical protein
MRRSFLPDPGVDVIAHQWRLQPAKIANAAAAGNDQRSKNDEPGFWGAGKPATRQHRCADL